MSASRAAHTATALPDGRVLVAGGFVEKGSAKSAETYDPEAGRLSPLPPMLTTRHSHTATLLPDGKVLIAGGYGEGTTTLAAAELFEPATRTFILTGSLAVTIVLLSLAVGLLPALRAGRLTIVDALAGR